MIDAVAVVASYVLASISFPYWIARAKGIDLRAFGGSALKLVMQALSTKKSSPEELAKIRQLLDDREGGTQ